jgi:uncharacterized membrane protein
MEKFGPIVAIALIAILLIAISSVFPVSPQMQSGLVFVGISILLFLVAGVTFSLHWIIGGVVGIIAFILFMIGIFKIV